MAGNEGQQQVNRESATPEEVETTEASDLAERKAQLDEDIDAILDEIDDVLEENAEEMVRGFVQKGGQ